MPPFEYAPFRSPFVSEIGQLIQAGPAAQAQGMLRSGQAWGGAVQQAGQDVAGTIHQAMDPQRQLAQQHIAANAQAMRANAIVQQISAHLLKPDGTIDREALRQGMTQAGIPIDRQAEQMKQLDAMEASGNAFIQSGVERRAQWATSILGAKDTLDPSDPGLHLGLAIGQSSGLLKPEDVARFSAVIDGGGDPTTLLKQLRAASDKYAPKTITIPATPRGGAPARVITSGGEPIAEGPSSPAQPPTEAELAVDAARGKPDAQGAMDILKPKPQPKAIESKNVLLDGKPAIVNFDPTSGKHTLPDGTDVSERVKPIPPASLQVQSQPLPPAPDIPVGSKEYRIAQDLAYGKLTFADFNKLYPSMSRDPRMAALKQGVYLKAGDLNPNFSPAQFEMGFKLASSPKVQQQMASFDNVNRAVPDLLKFSDAAERIGVTAINRFLIKGGFEVGGKRYSNFTAAQKAFADELSGALGYGTATDMKLAMGVDITNPNLSPSNFRSMIQDVVVPFVNRKRDSLLTQMGVYGQPGNSPAATSAQPPAPAGTTSDPLGIR